MAEQRRFSSTTAEIPRPQDIPVHVAIIMDGNGRWANKRGLPRIAGHRQGLEAVRATVKRCADRQVSYLTLFAFSSENWRRPPTEVNLLMELFTNALENKAKRLHENQVRLRVVGDLSRFSARIRTLVQRAEALTAGNRRLNLTVAANYGGRWDIEQACRSVCDKVLAGELDRDQVTSASIEEHLSTAFLPEPDLFIRTGGEQRISNFLLWQLAYTELYFTETLWPEFDESEVDKALASFASRQRRFGQTGEQIQDSRKLKNA